MTKLQTQINKLEKRLQEKPDPLLRDVLESLQKLEELSTSEGILDFFERSYCSMHNAAELTGIPYESIRQYATNYIKFPNSRRTKLPCRIFGKSSRSVYVLAKKALKNFS